MAIYNLLKYTTKDGVGLPLNFRRGNPNPLDNSSVHPSFEAASDYAKNDPIAYVGQILSVVNKAADGTLSVDVYKIDNEAGDLKKIDGNNGNINNDNENSNISAEFQELKSKFTELNDTIDTKIEDAVREVAYDDTDLRSIVTNNTKIISNNNNRINTITENLNNLQSKYIELNDTIDTKIEDAVREVAYDDTDLRSIVTNNQTDIRTMKQNIQNLQSKVTEISDTIDTKIDDAVSDLRNLVTNNGTEIENIKKDYLTSKDKQSLLDIVNSKVAQTSFDEFTSKVNNNTTLINILNGNKTVEGSVDYKIDKAFNDFITTETEDGVVNTYKELIDCVKNHDSEVTNMSSIISRLTKQVDENVTKINELENNGSVIEKVTINNEELTITNKTINIPVATSELFGVVKSSNEENKIIINNDGTMEVNGININKLVQTEDDILILDGSSWLLNKIYLSNN